MYVRNVSCGKDEGLIGYMSKKQKLKLWPGTVADRLFPIKTPGKIPRHEIGELERLKKLVNKYERGQIKCVDWLDWLAFKTMEKIKEHENSRNGHLIYT
ncbi:hypothetical protein FNV43_RR27305 [Rhamnella rubrinervis]|uniref:C2 PI3K-type domain-containing protein n=1 Tax=Rhamnella rubrinervis TaxID=2594499 RepID=A0A8K0GSE6_9ROSA|nr:hypothetical protein FNV43_RR27305 [Rhamnella rubrinervis]